MELLDSTIRTYAWGSRTAIASVQGRPVPTAEPEAELWMGAHPGAPSRLAGTGRSLLELIEAEPAAVLGAELLAEHGPRLPYLLKLLAADEPLSIQAHPDAEQARAGFEAEEAAGVPRDDPKRNYVDPYHKPELIYALSDFEALCGFREPADTLPLLARLNAPLFDEYVAELAARPNADGLRGAVTRLLTLPDQERTVLVAEVVEACRAQVGEAYELVVALADRYPGDVGAVLSLLFNIVRLRPGQVIFLSAGRPHAYLKGVGVELMASSDNVLRGGLTPKYVDVAELLRVLRFEPGPVAPLEPTEPAPGVRTWSPPVPEFALTRVTLDNVVPRAELGGGGPRIVFCLSGRLTADDGVEPVELTAGAAAFAPAGRSVTLAGSAVTFVAGPSATLSEHR